MDKCCPKGQYCCSVCQGLLHVFLYTKPLSWTVNGLTGVINTLGHEEHSGQHFPGDILQCIFSTEICCPMIQLHWCSFLLAQLLMGQCWLRLAWRRTYDNHYQQQWLTELTYMYICIIVITAQYAKRFYFSHGDVMRGQQFFSYDFLYQLFLLRQNAARMINYKKLIPRKHTATTSSSRNVKQSNQSR